MIQQLAVDAIVAAAAAWLIWTFAPFAVRRRLAALLPRGSRARATAASPLSAGGVQGLQAVEIDGRPEEAAAPKDGGTGCGCG